MLRSTREIVGYRMRARDGKIGRCRDLLFDERRWTVRYVVVDTGNWIHKHRVIISPGLFGEPVWNDRVIPVQLTKQQIEEAPPLDRDAPVSRRYEKKLLKRFNQPFYWSTDRTAGTPNSTVVKLDETEKEEAEAIAEEEDDTTHVRSTEEVAGYRIHATDGEIGKVHEFILDDETWILRYMVVDTRKRLPGRKVLVSLDWIQEVSWPRQMVVVSLTTEAIKKSPDYDPTRPVNREYEVRLYDFYGRPCYWKKD